MKLLIQIALSQSDLETLMKGGDLEEEISIGKYHFERETEITLVKSG